MNRKLAHILDRLVKYYGFLSYEENPGHIVLEGENIRIVVYTYLKIWDEISYESVRDFFLGDIKGEYEELKTVLRSESVNLVYNPQLGNALLFHRSNLWPYREVFLINRSYLSVTSLISEEITKNNILTTF